MDNININDGFENYINIFCNKIIKNINISNVT